MTENTENNSSRTGLYNRKSQNEVPQEENSFGHSNSVECEGKKYAWERFRSTLPVENIYEDTQSITDSFTEEYIAEQESFTRSSQDPKVKKIIAMTRGTDNTHPESSGSKSFTNVPEDKMCRICFAGSEEEDNLGHLISPCQCKGTMRVLFFVLNYRFNFIVI